MESLRTYLFDITENGDPLSHPCLIADLRSQVHHTIEVLPSATAIDQYTCGMHAFHLVDDEEYRELARLHPEGYASTDFVRYLICHGVLVQLDTARPDCLVVYFNQGDIKHIGRTVSREVIVSKWVTGHLYRHALFELPSSYGTEVKFYADIDRGTAIDWLKKFIQSKLVSR